MDLFEKVELPDYYETPDNCKILLSLLPATILRIGLELLYLFTTFSTSSLYSQYIGMGIALGIIFLALLIRIACFPSRSCEEISVISTILWFITALINSLVLVITFTHGENIIHPSYFKVTLPLLINDIFSFLTICNFIYSPFLQNYSSLCKCSFHSYYRFT